MFPFAFTFYNFFSVFTHNGFNWAVLETYKSRERLTKEYASGFWTSLAYMNGILEVAATARKRNIKNICSVFALWNH